MAARCKSPGCNEVVLAKGLCPSHYNKALHNGELGQKCSEPGCHRGVFTLGKCTKHHYQAVKSGEYGVMCIVTGCTGYSQSISKRGMCESCRKRAARYGMTVDDLSRLMSGVECELCHSTQASHVDHCHKTGLVRGFLCGPCNMSLGTFNDDPAKLRAAAEYLERKSNPLAAS